MNEHVVEKEELTMKKDMEIRQILRKHTKTSSPQCERELWKAIEVNEGAEVKCWWATRWYKAFKRTMWHWKWWWSSGNYTCNKPHENEKSCVCDMLWNICNEGRAHWALVKL